MLACIFPEPENVTRKITPRAIYETWRSTLGADEYLLPMVFIWTVPLTQTVLKLGK